MPKLNQNGFVHFSTIVMLLVLGGFGYFVYDRVQSTDQTIQDTAANTESGSTVPSNAIPNIIYRTPADWQAKDCSGSFRFGGPFRATALELGKTLKAEETPQCDGIAKATFSVVVKEVADLNNGIGCKTDADLETYSCRDASINGMNGFREDQTETESGFLSSSKFESVTYTLYTNKYQIDIRYMDDANLTHMETFERFALSVILSSL